MDPIEKGKPGASKSDAAASVNHPGQSAPQSGRGARSDELQEAGQYTAYASPRGLAALSVTVRHAGAPRRAMRRLHILARRHEISAAGMRLVPDSLAPSRSCHLPENPQGHCVQLTGPGSERTSSRPEARRPTIAGDHDRREAPLCALLSRRAGRRDFSSVLCDSLSRSVTNWAAMTELAGGPEAVPYDLVSRPF
jgi:hypothetical protein